MVRNPLTFRARCWFWMKLAVWFCLWGFPLGAIGILACLPIITIPIGLLILYVAALPLANMITKRTEEVRRWHGSPTPGMTTTDLDKEFSKMMEDSPWDE
jgi:hypothetical protein